MARIVVCGAGIVGMCAAMMLARDGNEVVVLEADSGPLPSDSTAAWEQWSRKGVTQFRQPHNMFPRFQKIIDEEIPELTQRLLDAGCRWVDMVESPPPTIQDFAPRPGDEGLRYVTGRRPVVECVVASVTGSEPGVNLRRAARVAELVGGAPADNGIPHVAGVRTIAGERIDADLVVDATGRNTKADQWLARIGARTPSVRSEDVGFIYYSRYFSGPELPTSLAPPLSSLGSFSLLTLPGDNGAWSVTVFTTTGDRPLKVLRDPEYFDRLVAACPLHSHWAEGEPLTAVLPLAGVVDRYRRFCVDDEPVVTGFVAVGDAWACTNPSAGRGLTVGLIHAQLLRDVVRDHLSRPGDLARIWDQITEERVAPFYWNQITADRARFAEMTALRREDPPPNPDPVTAAFSAAAVYDADVYRALVETIGCLALPQDVLARREVRMAMAKFAGQVPPALPGPTREELLGLLL